MARIGEWDTSLTSWECCDDRHQECNFQECACVCHSKPAEPPRTPEPQGDLDCRFCGGDGQVAGPGRLVPCPNCHPELTRAERNAMGDEETKAAQKDRDVIVHDSPCAECGSSFDNRLHKGCPRCAIAAVEGLLRWVYVKAEKIHAETVPMGSDSGHGTAAKLSGEILQRIREGVPAECPDPRLAELEAENARLRAALEHEQYEIKSLALQVIELMAPSPKLAELLAAAREAADLIEQEYGCGQSKTEKRLRAVVAAFEEGK